MDEIVTVTGMHRKHGHAPEGGQPPGRELAAVVDILWHASGRIGAELLDRLLYWGKLTVAIDLA